ncbi:ankyrin [Aspergillus steynii IBT 23096]|uniref:Ankyrin n=1 Tax=Aspergillus steynii IBT 23096 TaxID=1392250 RepID=A0A2I2GHK1_9EURO|nr:ankyrin [Aspergillus steynii IBT 23096]PLB52355.1 ankyrin [Aspergillus steynii IBT 23096]
MGMEDLSVEVLTNILQYLGLKTVIDLRLVSRFFNRLILVNLPHFKKLSVDMSDVLIAKLLYEKIINDTELFARVEKIAEHVNLTLSKYGNSKHSPRNILDSLSDALTYCCGRSWVTKNIRKPLDWTDDWGDDETMVLAAWLRCLSTVQGLLDSGRNIDLRHPHLGSLMYAAAYNDDEDLADILIEREMTLQYSEGAYGDPLQLAAYLGSEGVVTQLLLSGLTLLANAISVGYGPFGGPLGAAAAAGNQGLIGQLIYELQSSEIIGPDSKTPLHYAARNGHAETVRELLRTEPDSDYAEDDDGYSALDLAVKEGHLDVIKVFLDSLAPSDVRETLALQYACWFGHKDIAKTLMDECAVPPDTCNGEMPPAIFCAALRGHFEIVDILLAHDQGGIDFQDPTLPYNLLTRLAEKGCASMLEHILASGKMDVNDPDECQDTALHVACRYNRPRVVESLLQIKTLDPNIENSEGETALSIALDEEHDDIIEMLVTDSRVNK